MGSFELRDFPWEKSEMQIVERINAAAIVALMTQSIRLAIVQSHSITAESVEKKTQADDTRFR